MDLFVIFILSAIFSGTLGGMVVAMTASAIVSLYFLVSPPKFFTGILKEFRKELKDAYDDKPT